MSTPNTVLMQKARQSLHGRWGIAIGTCLLYSMIMGATLIPFATLIITGPLALGLVNFSLALSRDEAVRVEQLFSGFNRFGEALGCYLLILLYSFLWTLLFIIPGIIASISYSQALFILSEDPNISSDNAIEKSKRMMYGYKWKYFRLQLRFAGWALICLFTLGIGFLWLMPYMSVSYANFYKDVKENSLKRENTYNTNEK